MKLKPFRRFGEAVLPFLLRGTMKLDLKGQENVPKSGPLIIAANHANFVDPFIVSTFAGRFVLHFGKVELTQGPIFRIIGPAFMIIPVTRGAGDATAMKLALKALREGVALYVAPEGTRSKSGALQTGHEGAVILALRTGAPVVPCGMWGQKDFWGNLKRLRRSRVGARFGKPFRFVGPTKPGREELKAMTDEMMYRIAELMPVEWRGPYAGTPPPWQYTAAVEAVGEEVTA